VSEEYSDKLFGKKLIDKFEKSEKKREKRLGKIKDKDIGKSIKRGLSRSEIELNNYKYYKEFLYRLACFSFVSSVEIVLYVFHDVKYRKKLVKLCKKICEEFLFLENYFITKIEEDEKYKQIIKMFAVLDDESVIIHEESILSGNADKMFLAEELGYVKKPEKRIREVKEKEEETEKEETEITPPKKEESYPDVERIDPNFDIGAEKNVELAMLEAQESIGFVDYRAEADDDLNLL